MQYRTCSTHQWARERQRYGNFVRGLSTVRIRRLHGCSFGTRSHHGFLQSIIQKKKAEEKALNRDLQWVMRNWWASTHSKLIPPYSLPTSRRYPTGNDPNLPGKSYLAHQRRFAIITWRDNDREKRRRNRELSLFISLSLGQMACESYDIDKMHNELKSIVRTCRKAIMIETTTFKCNWIGNLYSLVSPPLISTRHSQCLRSTRAPLPQSTVE